MKIVKYGDVMKKMRIVSNDSVYDYKTGIEYLDKNAVDGVSYYSKNNIHINVNNVVNDIVNVNNGVCYYECDVERNCDVIENIQYNSTVNLRMCFVIGDVVHDLSDVREILFVAAGFTRIRMRFIFFEMPINDVDVVVHYKSYILGSKRILFCEKDVYIVGDKRCYINNIMV